MLVVDDRFGSIAPHRYARDVRGMSASPPIASELWHRSEMMRGANSCQKLRKVGFDHFLIPFETDPRHLGDMQEPVFH
jgi:hypothetical protein